MNTQADKPADTPMMDVDALPMAAIPSLTGQMSTLFGNFIPNLLKKPQPVAQVEEAKQSAPQLHQPNQKPQVDHWLGTAQSSIFLKQKAIRPVFTQQPTVGRNRYRDASQMLTHQLSKKRDYYEFESAYIEKAVPPLMQIEGRPSRLPSPTYLPDIPYTGSNQIDSYLPLVLPPVETRQQVTQQQPLSDQSKSLYMPPSISTVKPTLVIETQQEDETDLANLKEDLKLKEERENTLENAVRKLQEKITESQSDSRCRVQVKQSDIALSTNFYEFQSNLIYQQSNIIYEVPRAMQHLADNIVGGILQEIQVAYMYSDKELHLWRVANLENKFQLDFETPILKVAYLQNLGKSQKFIVILTTEKIHIHQFIINHVGPGNFSFTLPSVGDSEVISTDRNRYHCFIQTDKTRRIFIGGDNGKVSELIISGMEEGKQNTSLISKLIQATANKIAGPGSKMSKIDKSQVSDTLLHNIFGKFFTNSRARARVVMDIVEDVERNLLFVAISDQNQKGNGSDIEIYHLGGDGVDFKSIQKIGLSDIFASIEQRIKMVGLQSQFDEKPLDIAKLFFQNGELIILLSNATLIFLSILIMNEQSENSLPKTYCTFRLLDVITPQLDQFVNRYESMFDDYVPDNVTEFYQWKPLIGKPLFFNSQILPLRADQTFQIVQCCIVDEKYILLIQDLKSEQSYLLYLTPNFRRGANYKYTQYLASVAAIPSGDVSLGLSLIKNESSRVSISVLTDYRIYTFEIPECEDIMPQYISLLVANQALRFGQNEVNEILQNDFESFLQGQDLSVTMKALLNIILSNRQKDTFLENSFNQAFYQNYDSIFKIRGNTFGCTEDRSLKAKVLAMLLYVRNYQPNSTYREVSISSDVQNLALSYFLDFSTTANRVELNVTQNHYYNNAYRRTEEPTLNEVQRQNVIFESLAELLGQFMEAKLLAKSGEEFNPDLNSYTITLKSERLATLKVFIESNIKRLSFISVESDHFHDHLLSVPQSLHEEFEGCLMLLQRIIDGLWLLSEVIKVVPQKQIKSADKETLESLKQLTLGEYLISGIKNQDVCTLMESYISSIDINPLLSQDYIARFKEFSKSFLPREALSLFLGRRYLQYAYQQKGKKGAEELSQNLKKLGYGELLSFPRRVNLDIALDELMKNDMVVESVVLCLKCIGEIEDIKNLVLSSDDNSELVYILASQKMQYDQAIDCVIHIVREVFSKVQALEGGVALESKQISDDLKFVKELRSKLSIPLLTLEYLTELKNRITKLCLNSSSEILHLSFYEQLLQFKGGISEIKRIKSRYMASFISKLNVSELMDQVDTTKIITSENQLTLLKSKLEANYSHLINAQQYGECFIYLMNHVCNSDIRIEIKERIQWLQKAEGCLLKYQQSITSNGPDVQTQDICQLFRLKDYLQVLMQIHEAAIARKQAKAKVVDAVLEQLNYDIVNPDELYQIAINLKQWRYFIKIIEINELNTYSTEGSTIAKSLSDPTGTQSRIEFMYRSLLENKSSLSLKQSQKEFRKLQCTLKHLFKASKEFEKVSSKSTHPSIANIQLFPLKLILTLLEKQTFDYLVSTRSVSEQIPSSSEIELLSWWKNEKISKEHNHHAHWSPFWHIDYFIRDLDISSDVIFDILCSINLQKKQFTFNERSQVGEAPAPETYFSLAYFISKYAKKESSIQSSKRIRMLQVQEMLRESIQDDLLFPKGYAEKVIEITKLTESVTRDEESRIIPQQ